MCVCVSWVRGAYLFSRSASSIQRGALQLFGLSNFSWVDDVFLKGGSIGLGYLYLPPLKPCANLRVLQVFACLVCFACFCVFSRGLRLG